MLTLKKCKKILEDNSNRCYSEEEVNTIKAFLYASSQIVLEVKKDDNETME